MAKSKKQSSKVSFAKPPLIEVVCGVQFETVEKFQVAHIGRLWNELGDTYTQSREVMALVAPIELIPGIEPPKIVVTPSLMPRTILIASDNGSIVQVQRDAFYRNWQRKGSDDTYPRYEFVIERFEEELEIFNRFISNNELGIIKPIQFELTYLNEVPLTIESKVLKDAFWDSTAHKVLPEPEVINLVSQFLLPGAEGRLSTTFRNLVNQKGEPVFHWSLTVRGCTNPRSDMSLENLRKWFDNAHTWIVSAFTDLSEENCQQKEWERQS
jgi:uncharacterized protein (TIGR04255 family)